MQAPPPYPNPQQQGNNGAIPNKRLKGDENLPNRPPIQSPIQMPSFYLSQQQLQMLQHLQKNKDSLNQQQLTMLQQLMHRYQLMQQHQQSLRIQQMQMQQSVGPLMSPQQHQQNAHPLQSVPGMHMSQPIKPDQDIQAILSQNDTNTTLAENMLKQFGANIKEEIIDDDKNPMADSTTNISHAQQTIKCEATSTSARSPVDLKNEPVLKIENIFETDRKVIFNIQMDSKQIADAVR